MKKIYILFFYRVHALMNRFNLDQRGLTSIEYALIASIVTVFVVAMYGDNSPISITLEAIIGKIGK